MEHSITATPAPLRRWEFTVWLAIAAATFAVFGYRAWTMSGLTDTEAYYNAGLRARTSAAIYFASEPTPFKYLPPIAYLMTPLSWLSFACARLAIFFSSWLIGVAVYRGLIRRYGSITALLVFVAMVRFHNHDFLNLQINHWVLGLLIVFLDRRESRPWTSAFSFAGMALFKVTPILLAVPLLAAGRFRELARIAAAGAMLLVVPPFLHPHGILIYSDWYQLVKLTTPWPAPDFSVVQSVQSGLWYFSRDWIGPEVFSKVMIAIACGCVALLAIATRSARRSEGSFDETSALYAATLFAVILSPLAWKHHYVFALPAIAVIVASRRWMIYASFVLLSGIGPGLVTVFSKHVADRSYMTVIGAGIVAVSLLRVVPRDGIEPPTRAFSMRCSTD